MNGAGEKTLPELFKDLRDQSSELIREEVQLAKAEISTKAKEAARSASYIGVSAVAANGAYLCILASLSIGLFLLLDGAIGFGAALWLSPLIVGVTVALLAYAFAQKGLHGLRSDKIKPKNTIGSLEE